jgi:NADH-quinone oxidoreductase subunit J
MTPLLMWLVAFGAALSALLVVRTKNLVHAVLWLGVSLLCTAFLYALLEQSFLAGVQVLTYVGGIVTLMVFGVMVTGKHGGGVIVAESANPLRASLTALAFFAVIAWAVHGTPLADAPAAMPLSTPGIARALLGRYLLPFEATSLLLLAATVGAVVLARRRDVETASTEKSRRAALIRDNLRPAAPPHLTSDGSVGRVQP